MKPFTLREPCRVARRLLVPAVLLAAVAFAADAQQFAEPPRAVLSAPVFSDGTSTSLSEADTDVTASMTLTLTDLPAADGMAMNTVFLELREASSATYRSDYTLRYSYGTVSPAEVTAFPPSFDIPNNVSVVTLTVAPVDDDAYEDADGMAAGQQDETLTVRVPKILIRPADDAGDDTDGNLSELVSCTNVTSGSATECDFVGNRNSRQSISIADDETTAPGANAPSFTFGPGPNFPTGDAAMRLTVTNIPASLRGGDNALRFRYNFLGVNQSVSAGTNMVRLRGRREGLGTLSSGVFAPGNNVDTDSRNARIRIPSECTSGGGDTCTIDFTINIPSFLTDALDFTFEIFQIDFGIGDVLGENMFGFQPGDLANSIRRSGQSVRVFTGTPPAEATAIESVAADRTTVEEGQSVTVRVNLNGPAGEDVVMPYTISGVETGDIEHDHGDGDTDNNPLTGTVAIGEDSYYGETVIEIVADGEVEAETMTVTFAASTTIAGPTDPADGQVAVNVVDVPPTSVTAFARSGGAAAILEEGTTSVTVTATLDAPAPAGGNGIAIPYTIAGDGITIDDITIDDNRPHRPHRQHHQHPGGPGQRLGHHRRAGRHRYRRDGDHDRLHPRPHPRVQRRLRAALCRPDRPVDQGRKRRRPHRRHRRQRQPRRLVRRPRHRRHRGRGRPRGDAHRHGRDPGG